MKGKKNTAFNFDPGIYDSIFENFFRSPDRVKTFLEVNLTEKIKPKTTDGKSWKSRLISPEKFACPLKPVF
jgi:hypothetical protein